MFSQISPLWQKVLGDCYGLESAQIDQFKKYAVLLNQSLCNVTTIVDEESIILYHFADSLELGKVIDLNNAGVVDVGTGGGFPGIPIKIAYPSSRGILVEVVEKKRIFLKQVIDALGLEQISIESADWRTFLRTTTHDVAYVCARASLRPDELLRMMQPSSHYRTARLIYWASESWQPTEQEKKYIYHIHEYKIGDRARKLIFFKSEYSL